MTQCHPQLKNNDSPILLTIHSGRRSNRAFVALLNDLLSLPNLSFLCYFADWNSQTQSFDLVLTDFGERLRQAATTLNRTLLDHLYQEALADQEAALEAIQS